MSGRGDQGRGGGRGGGLRPPHYFDGSELSQMYGIRAAFMAGLGTDDRVDYERFRMKPCEWDDPTAPE